MKNVIVISVLLFLTGCSSIGKIDNKPISELPKGAQRYTIKMLQLQVKQTSVKIDYYPQSLIPYPQSPIYNCICITLKQTPYLRNS